MTISRRDVLKTAGCGCAALSLLDAFPGHLALAAQDGGSSVIDRLSVLPPRAVKFEGYFERYLQLSMARWNKGVVPYPALAAFFRTGRPTFTFEGREMEMFATGEMWGKAVRSAALFYRYTGDVELKDLLKQAVADLLGARRPNGTISCSPVEKQPDGPGGDLWERKYVLLGLDGYYEHVESDPRVLRAMIEEADATIDQVGPPPKKRIVDLGWSSGLVGGNNIESSTLLEPIMRLYRRTGEARYLEFARYIVETEGGAKDHDIFREVLAGRDPKDIGGAYPKAYEMLSLFEGLMEYYRVTGNDTWRQACVRLFQQVIAKEITLIGNGGGDEPYHPRIMGEAWDDTALEQTRPDMKRMMETCVGVTWMKFCHQMLRLTGDPAAADYIELYAYNGLFGAMKPQGDGFSYVNLLNGIKTEPKGWGTTVNGVYVTCCNLNGPVGLAYLPLIAVMGDSEGPVVNLYNPCTATVDVPERSGAHLKIRTDYPADGKIRIEVTPSASRDFVVKLRIPAWSQETGLSVNGKRMEAQPGRYVRIARRWAAGDLIDLRLDMRCRLVQAKRGTTPGSERFHALVRGPVVLARDENIDARFAEPVDIVAQDGVVDVKPVRPTRPDANLQFAVPTRTGTIQMVDYASVNSWEGKKVQTWLPIPASVSR